MLFVHEMDILKKFKHHTNIVSLMGFCYDQGICHYVCLKKHAIISY